MIKQNVLILHGSGNNSKGNWFPWLKSQLTNQGYNVWVPDLPDSDQPDMTKYLDFLFGNKDWNFNNSILIGHSSGAVTILGILQNLPQGTIIEKSILVSAFMDNLGFDWLSAMFSQEFDFAKIRSKSKKIILIHSDNDPYIPLDQAQYLADQLKAQLIIKKSQGHFNLEASPKYKKFPLIFDLI